MPSDFPHDQDGIDPAIRARAVAARAAPEAAPVQGLEADVVRHTETIRAIEIMLSRLKWNPDNERALRGHLENERIIRGSIYRAMDDRDMAAAPPEAP